MKELEKYFIYLYNNATSKENIVQEGFYFNVCETREAS